ncbi:DUF1329 domain-containing protein [Cupriavidus basilensis]
MRVLEAALKQGSAISMPSGSSISTEDSWYGVLADNYDSRGQLWRTNIQAAMSHAYDARRFYLTTVFYHDLISGAYLADWLTNEGAAAAEQRAEVRKRIFRPMRRG